MDYNYNLQMTLNTNITHHNQHKSAAKSTCNACLCFGSSPIKIIGMIGNQAENNHFLCLFGSSIMEI